eukprot:7035900-Pyramimonas_sp.AAC.1
MVPLARKRRCPARMMRRPVPRSRPSPCRCRAASCQSRSCKTSTRPSRMVCASRSASSLPSVGSVHCSRYYPRTRCQRSAWWGPHPASSSVATAAPQGPVTRDQIRGLTLTNTSA